MAQYWIPANVDVSVGKLLDELESMRSQHVEEIKARNAAGDRLSDATRAESDARMALDAAMSEGMMLRSELMTKIADMARTVDASESKDYQFRLAGTEELLKMATLAVAREKELAQSIKQARATLSEARAQLVSVKADYERVSAEYRVITNALRVKEEEIARLCDSSC